MRGFPAPAIVFAAAGLLASVPAPALPVINEFVNRPAAEEGEWIEIHNPGPDPVSLEGWTLTDGTGKARVILGPPPLEPGGFLILASRPESLAAAHDIPDSAAVLRPDGWPILNDRDGSGGAPADVIVLARPGGTTVDSVAYYEDWLPPEAGRSLERVDPANPGHHVGSWGWCRDPAAATPGWTNSLVRDEAAPVRGVLDGPDAVRPALVPAVFDYRLPGPGVMALWLVDREGREVAVLRPPGSAPAVGRWVWGSDGPFPPRPGLFLVCLRWRGEGTALVRECRSVWVTP